MADLVGRVLSRQAEIAQQMRIAGQLAELTPLHQAEPPEREEREATAQRTGRVAGAIDRAGRSGKLNPYNFLLYR
ncbi:MAG: hypothetical protein WDN69_12895 [Aliidongia sp.]